MVRSNDHIIFTGRNNIMKKTIIALSLVALGSLGTMATLFAIYRAVERSEYRNYGDRD